MAASWARVPSDAGHATLLSVEPDAVSGWKVCVRDFVGGALASRVYSTPHEAEEARLDLQRHLSARTDGDVQQALEEWFGQAVLLPIWWK